MKFFAAYILLGLAIYSAAHHPTDNSSWPGPIPTKIITGADQTALYFPYLKNKRVGVLANPTTIIGSKHLVDSLLAAGIQVTKAFGPEHGFRGNASAGVRVTDEKDPITGVQVISLYGSKRKPSAEDLADIDIMIYDVQDVGCRFYTDINVLKDIMEACADNKKELLILDRPNPNGYLIDGPILDMRLKSGIGMFPVPIAHGMTIGEFAKMINGEGWLPGKKTCKLKIIKVANYTHDMEYTLPVKPSPNLNTQQSIMLYPATCLFEGTILNHGRGTQYPFTIMGAPLLKDKYSFSYTPTSIPGMSEAPLHMNKECFGMDLRNYDISKLRKTKRINLEWLIELYNNYPEKKTFFDRTLDPEIRDFDKLAGNYDLKKQIIAGKSAAAIRATWEPGLVRYKKMRRKYLLYP